VRELSSEAFTSSTSVPDSLELSAKNVLKNNCNDCHGTQSLGGVSSILDTDKLIAAGLIVPGKPNESRILQATVENKMPPTYPLSASQQTTLRDWILAMGEEPVETPTEPEPEVDLAFTMTISFDLLPFQTRYAKVGSLLSSPTSPSLSKLMENRFLLGDHNYSLGVVPKTSSEVADMTTWLESLDPVCGSSELTAKYAWPSDASAFVQSALGRNPSSVEDGLVQEISQTPSASSNQEKFKIFCMTILSSLEFTTK